VGFPALAGLIIQRPAPYLTTGGKTNGYGNALFHGNALFD
jgi:hypothetical protein